MNDHEFLKTAAQAVEDQALENPEIAIPVEPEVADFMGAFSDPAIDPDDFEEPEAA